MKDLRTLEEIWAKFVYEDELDPRVQPAVADGWRRCKDAGLNPIGGRGRRVTDEVFASIREANAELIDAAMPEDVHCLAGKSPDLLAEDCRAGLSVGGCIPLSTPIKA